MNKRHKHYDVIVAWAEGEEVEVQHYGEWVSVNPMFGPQFDPAHEYRVKPKTVKKEGWVNVHPTGYGYMMPTKEEAEVTARDSRVACIRIEWEETLE